VNGSHFTKNFLVVFCSNLAPKSALLVNRAFLEKVLAEVFKEMQNYFFSGFSCFVNLDRIRVLKFESKKIGIFMLAKFLRNLMKIAKLK